MPEPVPVILLGQLAADTDYQDRRVFPAHRTLRRILVEEQSENIDIRTCAAKIAG